MYLILSIVVFIVAILLILIVLVQNSKGGGLSSNFASTNQVMGVRKTTETIEKLTWILAGILMAASVLASGAIPTAKAEKSEIEGAVQTVDPASMLPGGTGFEATSPDAAEVPAESQEVPAAE